MTKVLKHREDIIIRNANKGGAVAILHFKRYYFKNYKRQLNSTRNYRHLEHDPKTKSNASVNKMILRLRNNKLIGSKISDGLKVKSQIMTRSY